MHIGIFTWGSRGDVQPFVALSLALQKEGHEISLFAPGNFKEFVEAQGIRYFPLYGNTDEVLYSPEGRRVLKSGNTLTLLRLMQREGKKTLPLVVADLLEGAKKVDYILTSVLLHIWISSIAEKLNKKWGLMNFGPPSTPTRKFPFAGLAYMNNPLYNKASHQFFEWFYWSLNKKGINEFRKSISLPVLNKNIMNRLTEKNILNLYAISPALIPPPEDWPSNSDISGYIYRSSANGITEEKNLQSDLNYFVQSGTAPVYIGMGSMPIPDPELFKNIIVEILRTTAHRIIFCKGWSVVSGLPEHENLLVVDQADHNWLLPRCKVAVIHGGAGTIAACLKAKTPMVIASVFGDQPWWGKMIQDKSLGLHIPIKKLTAKKLTGFIDQLQSPFIKENVSRIGDKINEEDGLGNAASKIISYFS